MTTLEHQGGASQPGVPLRGLMMFDVRGCVCVLYAGNVSVFVLACLIVGCLFVCLFVCPRLAMDIGEARDFSAYSHPY